MLGFIKDKLGFSQKQNFKTKPPRRLHPNYRSTESGGPYEINGIDSKHEARLDAKGYREQAAKTLKTGDTKAAKKTLGDSLLMESIAHLQDDKYRYKLAKKRWLPHAKSAIATLERTDSPNARQTLSNAITSGRLTAADLGLTSSRLNALLNRNIIFLEQHQTQKPISPALPFMEDAQTTEHESDSLSSSQ
ncbi:hypothetical protein ACFL2U_03605 [Patescibacteria group bacterium]